MGNLCLEMAGLESGLGPVLGDFPFSSMDIAWFGSVLLAMSGEVGVAGLREERLARRAGIMVWLQSVVILLLLVSVSNDYNHNQYFQAWAIRNLAGFGFLLNGIGAAFYAGILVSIFVFRTLPGLLEKRARGKREHAVVRSLEDEVLVNP